MIPPAEDVRRPSRTSSVVTVALAVLALGFVLLVGLRSALATSAGPALGLAPATPMGTIWKGMGPPPTTGYATPGPAGVPAIQPNAALAQAGGAGPYFTEADVRQYFAAHRSSFTVPGTPNPVVVSGQFLTAKQASAQLGEEEVAASDSTLVCLVFVSRIFQDTTAPIVGTPPTAGTTVTQGAMVFDAHTGNLLVNTVG
jgi:hypothetical protein